MKINPRKLQAIISLPGPDRYSHFIKVAADQRKVWGLYLDGWVLFGTETGQPAFPIWPDKAYAELCAVEDWKDCEPEEIDLDDLMDDLVPKLKTSKDLLVVFPTPSCEGVIPDMDQLISDLKTELLRIE
jgi:hypothetical protein